MLGRARAELRPCLGTAHKSQVGLDISSSLGGLGIPCGTAGRMWPGVDCFSKRHIGNTPDLCCSQPFHNVGLCFSREGVKRPTSRGDEGSHRSRGWELPG